MVARENRSHPRARVAQVAEIELRAPLNRRVPAEVRSASASGLGLTLSGKDAASVMRGKTVTVHLPVERESLQLPAKIAWRRPAPGAQTADAGVHVHLEIAGTATRDAYRRWVERLLRSARI
jgi:hypothetical protein